MANILILDDSNDLLNVFKIILEINGYEAKTADTKNKFLWELENHKPDLIFLDINVGDADGRELCKNLKQKEETKHIPVILISASRDKLESFEDCHADDIIEKPFSIKDIKQKIESLLIKS